MSSEALQKSSWLHGPQFLRTSDFPFQPNTYVMKNSKLKSHSTKASSSEKTSTLITDVFKRDFSLPFRKFSSYPKLLRILAFCMRLLPRHLAYRSSGKEIVDPEELNAAERKLQLIIQSESFPLEQKQLAQEKQINKKSRIAVYSPFIGTGGLLRSTGRVKRLAEIDFDLKHPIILDGRHPLVLLFLRHMHLKHHHEGVDYLRALIQQRFAVLKLRSTLRSNRFSCVLCRKRNATPVQPMMADLPSERLGFQGHRLGYGCKHLCDGYRAIHGTSWNAISNLVRQWDKLFGCRKGTIGMSAQLGCKVDSFKTRTEGNQMEI